MKRDDCESIHRRGLRPGPLVRFLTITCVCKVLLRDAHMHMCLHASVHVTVACAEYPFGAFKFFG